MNKITIFHNPRCVKSRETLALLESKGVKAEIVEYLKTPPTAEELKEILQKLGLKAEDIVRKSETLYKEKFADKKHTEVQWIKILVNNPVLIERPIVVNGKKASLGRPPEKVLDIL